MNKFYTLLFLSFIFQQASAQFFSETGDTLYGNEWINYDQQYFKIPVAEDGIYRVSYNDLVESGVPVTEFLGRHVQLFHDGKEQPIYLTNKNTFGEADFIEFYGEMNRGELDEIFYENPTKMQLNPEYSLFTDTAAYFLTWNSSGSNLRVDEVETDLSSNFLPAEKYYMHKERKVFSSRINKPTRNGADNVRYSHFDVGEGFGGSLAVKSQFTLNASNIYENGPDPNVGIRFTTNATSHIIDLSVNGIVKNTFSHGGYKLNQANEAFDLSELKASNKIILQGTKDNLDRNIVSVVELNYPRLFDLDNKDFVEIFIKKSFFEKYVEIENFDGGTSPVIYDPASFQRIVPVQEDDKLKFIIPAGAMDRNIIIFNSKTATKSVLEIMHQPFTDYGEIDHDYIVISHPKLMEGTTNMVKEYADYRSSAAGGNFNSVVVDINQLYAQFSYGIMRHSYSVKNFVNYVSKNWTDPKYVVIIGKGREYGVYRTKAQIDDPKNADSYVPTYGLPGSDNLLVSKGTTTKNIIPTGRIAAKNINDIEIYLGKVKDHESFDSRPLTIEERLWKKRIMHLAGASTELQESIGSYLDAMAQSIEGNYYGGEVTTFKKSSTETIQEADADNLLNNIDRGLSLLTFFGHSSVGTFDFNIDDVNKLNNKGKYPLVVSLGCYSGNIHTSSFGISEQYLLTNEKGAIGFLASSSTAYVAPQGSFGRKFYDKIGNENYGQGIGDVLNAALGDFEVFQGIHIQILKEQITLHGDPAIKLHNAEGPDYVFDYQSFKTDPNIVESNESEFDLEFKVANLGRYKSDSLNIKLEHFKSDGKLNQEFELTIPAPRFDTLLNVTIVNNDFDNVGKNVVKGELDALKAIEELPGPGAENNNLISDESGEEGFVFYSINNSAEPVSPCDYGIYNEEKVILKASSYNALSKDETTYIIEIDSTANFDSPIRERKAIQSAGGLMEFEPTISFEEGKSYYWRVSPDSLSQDISYKWENSSFVYLPNSSNGWNQSHYFQFLDNDYQGITIDDDRQFDFDGSGFYFNLHNGIWDPNTVGVQYNFSTFSVSARPWILQDAGVGILVVDSLSGTFWVNGGGDFGSIKSSSFASYRVYAFNTDTPENRMKVVEFLEDVIPDNNFVYFMTTLRTVNSDFSPEEWADDENIYGKSIFSVLENQGAILVRDLEEIGSVPYNFAFQKSKRVLGENIAQNKSELIKTTAFNNAISNEGSLKSITIGPSTKWDKLVWQVENRKNNDTISLNIIGVDSEGNEKLILENLKEFEIDISFIDPVKYKYIKVVYTAKDIIESDPPKINFLRVFYTGYTDLALNPEAKYEFRSDTLQQGEPLIFNIQIDNLSSIPTDSISTKIEITDINNNTVLLDDKHKGLLPNDNFIYSLTHETADLSGKYQFSFNLNSTNEILEKHNFNNFGIREFVVIKDVRNPILDVMFDGMKIMEGDLISPTPDIIITIKDENQFVLLDDPSIVEISLIHPDNTEENIEITDDRINFIPANSLSENLATIEFYPDLTEDGFYSLKVFAKDISNNSSGDVLFERSFEIINDDQISNLLAYPNPFSTSTEFVFTLTGREVPEEIKIQIMTVSGKTVKEIFKEELGPLKIGINRTMYKWDGRDEFGSDLANGVYLYRVVAKNGINENIKKHSLGLETNFKNSIGKLVILR